VPHLEHIDPAAVAPPRATYSHAIRSGDVLWLAGQVPIDADGRTVGVGDVEAQARQVLRNIGLVLEDCGGTFSDVVRFTIYVVGRENVPVFREARSRLLKELYHGGNYPTSTLVVVEGLASEEFIVEIEATAVLQGNGSSSEPG
jgi:enamine deaminase RidA (YjgF/YER057c/UK114 family)